MHPVAFPPGYKMKVHAGVTSTPKMETPRNACFAQRLIPKADNVLNERPGWREFRDPDHKVDDGLGSQARNSRTADVLHIVVRQAESSDNPNVLGPELCRPRRLVFRDMARVRRSSSWCPHVTAPQDDTRYLDEKPSATALAPPNSSFVTTRLPGTRRGRRGAARLGGNTVRR
jgi:hypothetical protein